MEMLLFGLVGVVLVGYVANVMAFIPSTHSWILRRFDGENMVANLNSAAIV